MKKLLIHFVLLFAFVSNSIAQQASIPGTPGFIAGPAGYISDIKAMEKSPANIRFTKEPVIVNQFFTDKEEDENDGLFGSDNPVLKHINFNNPANKTARIKYIDPQNNVVTPALDPSGLKVTSQQPAVTRLGNQQTGLDPSDAQMAVGPNHIVVLANGDARILDKQTGAIISQVTLPAFFSWSGFVFDPRIFYDPYGQRWVALALKDVNKYCTGVDSKFRVLISNNSDPTQGWYYYEIDFDANNQAWYDFAMLGFNKDWICVAGHALCTNVPAIFVLNKTQAYAGTSVNYYWWNALWNAAPAFTYDNSISRLYLVKTGNPNNGGTGYIDSWYIDGTPSLTPSYSYGSSPWQAFASDSASCPKQLGGVSTFTAVNIFGASFLSNCVYRNGLLWCVHPIFLPATGSTNRASTQWWAVNPNAGTISQVGRIDDGTAATQEYYPSIGVNSNNDAVVTYSIFNASYYQSAAYNYRNSSDAVGQLPNGVFYYSGGANDPDGRGGDYSQACVDPLDDQAFWCVNQIPVGTWETRYTSIPGYYGCYIDANFGNVSWTGVTKNEASNSITSAEMIQAPSMVDYDAGSYIVLAPGFVANQGSLFKAYINGCGGAKSASSDIKGDLPMASTLRNIEINSMNLSVFPNPTDNKFNFRYQLETDRDVSIRIYNTEMKLIKSKTIINLSAGEYNDEIDVKDLKAGIYFAKFESGDFQKTIKLAVINK